MEATYSGAAYDDVSSTTLSVVYGRPTIVSTTVEPAQPVQGQEVTYSASVSGSIGGHLPAPSYSASMTGTAAPPPSKGERPPVCRARQRRGPSKWLPPTQVMRRFAGAMGWTNFAVDESPVISSVDSYSLPQNGLPDLRPWPTGTRHQHSPTRARSTACHSTPQPVR